MNKIKNVIVIGCSGCGALAAQMLKQLEPATNVTIIREPEESGLLTRCATPYICCGDVTVNASYKSDTIFTEKEINLINESAVRIDRKGKNVIVNSGKEIPYDKLVLATGSRPIELSISGLKLPGVFTLRSSGDAFNILSWINSKRIKNCVLLGAGAIGIEKSYLLSRQGVKVTIVEMMEHIMPTILDDDMSSDVQLYMKERGVDLKLGKKVTAIMGKDEVEGVTLDSGDELAADMVVISTGTKCNTALAKQSGLKLGRLGVMVNQYLQTSDPDVYAGGDLIEYPNYITGKPSLGQLRPNAVIAGRVIAKNILGFNIKYPPFINSFCTKFYDKCIAGTGISETAAKKEGIAVVIAKSTSTSQHSMMRGRQPYTVKLIFNKENQKIIGGQIVSNAKGPIKHIDLLAMAIRCGLTVNDLTTLRCAGQPELSADPGKEPIALAAEDAFVKFLNN